MAAPSPPFATSAAVAAMMPTTVHGASDFDDVGGTVPTKSAVTTVINLISSQVEMQFQMAGYVVPLAVVSGESWPSSQTTYLQLVTTLGAAAMAGGHGMKPLPALGPGRTGGTGNIFQDLYEKELRKIYDQRTNRTYLHFRADYYAGSAAEKAILTPKGPTTDFLEGKHDPMRYLSNWEITDKILDIQRSMSELEISWDYLYSVFSINKGFGTSEYEIS